MSIIHFIVVKSPTCCCFSHRTHITRGSERSDMWSTCRIGLQFVSNLNVAPHGMNLGLKVLEPWGGVGKFIKVFEIGCYQESLAAYFALGRHEHINQVVEILLGEQRAYVFFERSHGDMHSFVRTCKKLREDEAAKLFRQIASAVAHCHDNGVVLRDLKLRKFVFRNEDRSLVKLESLEDTYILEGHDDSLSDKHGCPAYVSPEILNASGSYSGKAADVWSLGVMLYTILVGRYPFHDVEPGSLFSKIRRGHFSIPETLTPKAKCLIRSILRREPAERLTSREILEHPWFLSSGAAGGAMVQGRGEREQEQTVPEVNMEEELDQFFS
eukprot:XP_014000634.1 PREDICTED: tribbles homolog 2-like isoform X2 [Salmo salar]